VYGVGVSVLVVQVLGPAQDYDGVIVGGVRKMIPSDVDEVVGDFVFV
jgi:hypothetical protein